MRRLTDQATRAGLVIYTIDPRGLPSLALSAGNDVRNPRRAAREQDKRVREFQQTQEPLPILAADTGRRAFLNSNAVDDSLRRVLDDQAGFYLLGYNPEDTTFDRKYHKIAAKVTRKGLEVRSRNGFVGVEFFARPAIHGIFRLSRVLSSTLAAKFCTGDCCRSSGLPVWIARVPRRLLYDQFAVRSGQARASAGRT